MITYKMGPLTVETKKREITLLVILTTPFSHALDRSKQGIMGCGTSKQQHASEHHGQERGSLTPSQKARATSHANILRPSPFVSTPLPADPLQQPLGGGEYIEPSLSRQGQGNSIQLSPIPVIPVIPRVGTNCKSDGHILREEEQCGWSKCACKRGCLNTRCPICSPSIKTTKKDAPLPRSRSMLNQASRSTSQASFGSPRGRGSQANLASLGQSPGRGSQTNLGNLGQASGSGSQSNIGNLGQASGSGNQSNIGSLGQVSERLGQASGSGSQRLLPGDR